MKEIVEYLQHKNIIFKSLKEISPKELGSRKKILKRRVGYFVKKQLNLYYYMKNWRSILTVRSLKNTYS
jgi:hypothetical protein